MANLARANAPVETLLKQISRQFDGLSKQLKVIARHVEEHRDQIGLEGIQDLARQCGVQPSAVVRFAKHFGFSGSSEMQKVFRDVLASQISPSRNYKTRIRRVIESGAANLVAITDSRMSPLARQANALLLVQDHATFGFRSLSSTMALAQSLFMALAYRLDLGYEPVPLRKVRA